MLRRLLWPVFLLVVGLAMPALIGGFDSVRMLSGIPAAGWGLLGGVMVVVCALEMLRAWILLRSILLDMTPGRAIGIYFAVMLAGCLTPYGVLAPVMFTFLLGRHGVGPRFAIATLLVTTLLDVFAMTFWMLVGITVETVVSFRLMVPWMAVASCVALMLCLMLFATLFVRYPRWWLQVLAVATAALRIPLRQRRRLMRALLRLRHTVVLLFARPVTARLALFAVSLLYWGIFLSVMYVSARVAGLVIPWSQAVLLQLVATSAGHLAGLPGGMVSSEAAGILLLSPMVGAASAVTIVLLWRFLTFHFYVFAGVVTLPLVSRYFGKGGGWPIPGRNIHGRE